MIGFVNGLPVKIMGGLLALLLLFQSAEASIYALTVRTHTDPQKEAGELKVVDKHIFSREEMENLWRKFSDDAGWQSLVKHMSKTGSVRTKRESASWGFRGTLSDGKDALFCAYDFHNPKNPMEVLTMVWIKRGNQVYKAYMVLPEGAMTKKNFSFESFGNAMEEAQEWYVDADNTVQKANSFSRCLLKQMKRNSPMCLWVIAACGGATAILAIATGGLGLAEALIILYGCAQAFCAQILTVSMFQCYDQLKKGL